MTRRTRPTADGRRRRRPPGATRRCRRRPHRPCGRRACISRLLD
jgi:hypothetical protein